MKKLFPPAWRKKWQQVTSYHIVGALVIIILIVSIIILVFQVWGIVHSKNFAAFQPRCYCPSYPLTVKSGNDLLKGK